WLDGEDSQQKRNTYRSSVGPDYFKTLGARLVAGREFDERDTTDTPKVAIVNEAFARMLLNGANPVGRSFWIEKTPFDPETRCEIVGWVKDTKYGELREEFVPIVFLPTAQNPRQGAGVQFLIRSSLPQTEIVAAVRCVLADAHPAIR